VILTSQLSFCHDYSAELKSIHTRIIVEVAVPSREFIAQGIHETSANSNDMAMRRIREKSIQRIRALREILSFNICNNLDNRCSFLTNSKEYRQRNQKMVKHV